MDGSRVASCAEQNLILIKALNAFLLSSILLEKVGPICSGFSLKASCWRGTSPRGHDVKAGRNQLSQARIDNSAHRAARA